MTTRDPSPAPEQADRALIEAVRSGDRRALETLLARHQPRILRFAMKMCSHPDDAEEVLQDTMIAAARGLGEFRGASSVSTWLWTIARSFCIKRRRRSKFAPEATESLEAPGEGPRLDLPDPGRDPEQALVGREIQAALDNAIASLEPANREVLLLRDVEGLTAPEVAAVLGISVLAVKSRLHRARVVVREQVAPLLGAMRKPSPACPDVAQLLSQHLEGEISPDSCAEMERHLAECGGCQDTCESLKRVLALCKRAPAPDVPEGLKESVRTALRALVNGG